MEYPVVIEQRPRNFTEYAPDLPSRLATAATKTEVVSKMRTQPFRAHITDSASE